MSIDPIIRRKAEKLLGTTFGANSNSKIPQLEIINEEQQRLTKESSLNKEKLEKLDQLSRTLDPTDNELKSQVSRISKVKSTYFNKEDTKS